jgi:hypothetical protein
MNNGTTNRTVAKTAGTEAGRFEHRAEIPRAKRRC